MNNEAEATDAGIQLVLGDGHRQRLRKGVVEEMLWAVLAAPEP